MTMTYEDGVGRMQTVEVRSAVDAQDYIGKAVYPYLIMAANPHLSSTEIALWLERTANTVSPGTARPAPWIKKRRWMARGRGAAVRAGAKPYRDGREAAVQSLMAANPTLSLRDLSLLLKEHGIVRSREWLRRHRVACGLTGTQSDHK